MRRVENDRRMCVFMSSLTYWLRLRADGWGDSMFWINRLDESLVRLRHNRRREREKRELTMATRWRCVCGG